MSFAAFDVKHVTTNYSFSVPAFLTHCRNIRESYNTHNASISELELLQYDYPNIVAASKGRLEVFKVNSSFSCCPNRLELACEYTVQGDIEGIDVLCHQKEEDASLRDSLVVTFSTCKVVVLEFDEATHQLKPSSLHYMEGPEKDYVKRGRTQFSNGPIVRTDPRGRCSGILLYDSHILILKSAPVYSKSSSESTRGLTSSPKVSESYLIDLSLMGLRRVVDFTFLHGYDEPALALLSEDHPTNPWMLSAAKKSGAHKQADSLTRTVLVLSLNTLLKTHPLLFTRKNLPYDVCKLVAVKSPLGGVLVLGRSSIHYCSHAASCEVALNPHSPLADIAEQSLRADGNEGNNAAVPEDIYGMELSSISSAWLSLTVLLMSVNHGDMLQLQLNTSGRRVTGISLSLVCSPTQMDPACMTSLHRGQFKEAREGLVFFGSCLGDSLLMKYECQEEDGALELSSVPRAENGDGGYDFGDQPNKRMKGSNEDSIDSSLFPVERAGQTKLSLKVVDCLPNAGPIADWTWKDHKSQDIVACTGHGKTGSLTTFSRALEADLTAEVEIPGISSMWPVASSDKVVPLNSDACHAFLFLSLKGQDQTLVLDVADGLSDATGAGDFYCEGPTLVVGNACNNQRIVQVYPEGLRVFQGSKLTQGFSLGDLFPSSEPEMLSFASVEDPFIIVITSLGRLLLLSADTESCSISLAGSIPAAPSSETASNASDRVTAATLFIEPWLHQCSAVVEPVKLTSAASSDSLPSEQASDVLWLRQAAADAVSDSKWMVAVVWQSGRLEFRELPSLSVSWSSEGFSHGRPTLSQSGILPAGLAADQAAVSRQADTESTSVTVTGLSVSSCGSGSGRPVMIAVLSDGRCLCYRAFCCHGFARQEGEAEGSAVGLRLAGLRWKRESTHFWTEGATVNLARNVGGGEGNKCMSVGWFLTGKRPGWLVLCRDKLKFLPQSPPAAQSGQILAFSVLNSATCPKSYMIASESSLSICPLPAPVLSVSHSHGPSPGKILDCPPHVESDWIIQKNLLEETPRLLTRCVEGPGLFFVSSSPPAMDQAQKQSEMKEAAAAKASDESYRVLLATPGIGHEVKGEAAKWRVEEVMSLEDGEAALALKAVALKPGSAAASAPNGVVLGTGFCESEDVPCRGRLMLFLRVPDQPAGTQQQSSELSKWSLALCREVKGAVSAVASLGGLVVAAVGRRLTVYNWRGGQLDALAFYETPVFTVAISTVKQFVMVADVTHSLHFVQWSAANSRLTLLGRDFALGNTLSTATDCLVHGPTLSLLLADVLGNMQFFQYSPKSVDKGQKLLVRGELHTGFRVSQFLRQALPANHLGHPGTSFGTLAATMEGAMLLFVPLPELTFRRLKDLQGILTREVPQNAGMNPLAYMQFKQEGGVRQQGENNAISMELVSQFELLEVSVQQDVAKRLGTTWRVVQDDLQQIRLANTLVL